MFIFRSVFKKYYSKFTKNYIANSTKTPYNIFYTEKSLYNQYKKDVDARMAKEYLRPRDMILNLYVTYKYRKYTAKQDAEFDNLVEGVCNPNYLSKVKSFGKSQMKESLNTNTEGVPGDNLIPQNIIND